MQLDARLLRVGLTVVVAMVVLAIGIVVLGERQFLFTSKNRYFVRWRNVNGLADGNPVQLNGVNVGKVQSIVLPEAMEEEFLEVWISIDRRYAERLRGDSLARIKTLGLLGDKFVEVTSGSPASPVIDPENEIPAAPATDVDQLISSGEDVVENILSVAHSLATLLGRMERGEGILGELFAERADGKRLTDSLNETLLAVQSVAEKVDRGQGPLGRLINDEELGERLTGTIDRLDAILAQVEGGDGLLPVLLHDPATRQKFDTALDDLGLTLDELAAVTSALKEGDGLLPRLLNDPEYGAEISEELHQLLQKLNQAAGTLTTGEGTVSQLMNDPEVYQGLNDILVGINESRFLRWLIRNRQKAGIKKRYQEQKKEEQERGHVQADGPP